jgi:hypothetical protein
VDIASRSNDNTQTPENRDDLNTKAFLMSSRIVGIWVTKLVNKFVIQKGG